MLLFGCTGGSNLMSSNPQGSQAVITNTPVNLTTTQAGQVANQVTMTQAKLAQIMASLKGVSTKQGNQTQVSLLSVSEVKHLIQACDGLEGGGRVERIGKEELQSRNR